MTDFAQHRGSLTSPRAWPAWLAVVAFHGALLALFLSAQAGRVPIPQPNSIEWVFVPPDPKSQRPEVRDSSAVRRYAPVFPPPAPPALPGLMSERAGPGIDWGNEAKDVARTFSADPDFRSFDRSRAAEAAPGAKSIFPDQPAHRAGEQFKTGDGRRAVFVSDECYQLSDPLASADALHGGMGVQTYCIGHSREVRGDLFEPLAAYKRLHPTGAAAGP